MIKNYFIIAYRNLIKNKVFSFVNLLGFTLGFVAFIFIALYVADELSYDRFHKQAAHIYRLTEHVIDDKGERHNAKAATRIAPAAIENFAAVKEAVRLNVFGRFTLGYNDFRDYEILYTSDESFFRIFDCSFIEGDATNALSNPYSIVLTKTLAHKYFGNESPLGKSMYNNRFGSELKVTAVIEDFPANSHMRPGLLIPFSSMLSYEYIQALTENDWYSHEFATYLLLDEQADTSRIARGLTEIANRNRDEMYHRNSYHLQALTDIHFHSHHLDNDYIIPGSMNYIYIFAGIGLLILLVAFVNYINLSTARAMKRVKEVGLRKAVGASRKQLMYQFICESLLLVLLTMILAITIVQLLLPAFNDLAYKALKLDLLDGPILAVLLVVALISGLLAGAYPAFYLSGIHPSLILKQQWSLQQNSWLRQMLVVGQFSFAILMISLTIVNYQQMDYIRNADLGYEREQLLAVDINSGVLRSRYEAVKSEFESIPQVQKVSAVSRIPGDWKGISRAGIETDHQNVDFLYLAGDEDFLPTFGIQLLEGRNFINSPADSAKVILNQTAVKALDLTDPIGKRIKLTHFNQNKVSIPFEMEVIGVIQDVHFEKVHHQIAPTLITYRLNPFYPIDYYTLKIGTEDVQAILSAIDKLTQEFDPENPLEYNFLDDKFEELYLSETKSGELISVATFFAILIACMGLFGLTNFSVEQRTKEVGVRKVLGAEVWQIVWLISRKFMLLISIAFFITTPIGWWLNKNWLNEFAYHIDLTLEQLLLSALSVILVSLITISYQTIKAALANPANSLRYE
ncbi:ABC transporter permease [Porifericola rhodea]|uniref:ABC transporter permease n=1 Tax=Porifericola rhodea TaxID=930972 RepID=UPI002666BC2C|nr:ABC transporter permease [Porifericola rhodea]WKN30507.1 ABC transporter permease [Porifericola rhodea]